MTVSRVGSPAYSSPSGTSLTGTLPNTAAAGNLLLIAVALTRGSSAPTCSTPSGWTAGPTVSLTNGANRGAILLFWKLAAGSDANPIFTISSSTSGACIAEEWSGLDASTPHDADSTGASRAGIGTSVTLTDSITTSVANEWVWSALAEMSSSVALSAVSWGGGQSADSALHGTSVVEFATGAAVFAGSGAQSPNVTFTAGTGANYEFLASMAFVQSASGTPASISPPAGAATADATSPGIAAGAVLAMVAAAAIAGAASPGVSSGVNLTVPSATATADATSPAIAAGVNIGAPSAAATASAVSPTISAGGATNVSIPSGAAVADATAPGVAAGVNVGPPSATAVADATAPVIAAGGGDTITAIPAAPAVADATPPAILTATAFEGDFVTIWDTGLNVPASEHRALVALAGALGNDDSLDCPINQSLIRYLPEGIRDPGAGESVEITQRGLDWVVTDIVGKEPTQPTPAASVTYATDPAAPIAIGSGIEYIDDPADGQGDWQSCFAFDPTTNRVLVTRNGWYSWFVFMLGDGFFTAGDSAWVSVDGVEGYGLVHPVGMNAHVNLGPIYVADAPRAVNTECGPIVGAADGTVRVSLTVTRW